MNCSETWEVVAIHNSLEKTIVNMGQYILAVLTILLEQYQSNLWEKAYEKM